MKKFCCRSVRSNLGPRLPSGHQPSRQRKVRMKSKFQKLYIKLLMHLLVSLVFFFSLHPRYAALITSLMAKDCRYLLDTLLYNPQLYPGKFTFSSQWIYIFYDLYLLVTKSKLIPQVLPFLFLMSKSTVCSVRILNATSNELYFELLTHVLLLSSGNACEVELLQSADAFTERHKSWGLDFLTENVFLLTTKSN